LGRIAASQSNFYEVQADYYHQLAVLSERQTRTEEQMIKILKHLSLTAGQWEVLDAGKWRKENRTSDTKECRYVRNWLI